MPSCAAQSTARSESTASMTARMSSILVSSVGTCRTGSESPLPRLSKRSARAERGKPLDVVDEERHVPAGEQVGERSADEDEVGRALADDLVGDRDVAASGVADVRNVHGRILPSWPRPQQSGSS